MGMPFKGKVLVVDDEAPIREVLAASLQDEGYEIQTASDGEAALKAISSFQPQVVLLDIWMPGSKDGLDVLREGKPLVSGTEFVIMSGHGTIETAVKATKLGAWDFLEKPLSMERVFILVSNIILYQQEKQEKNLLLNRLRRNIALIGESQQMMKLKQAIARLAPASDWVLISGENGTGKELVAQNIHYLSPRAGKPFVEVSCASIPEELIESELFGYEKGAFTGANTGKKGKFDMANGGTLYLDEVCALSAAAQTRILRVLKEKRFERVGGQDVIEVDVRLIAASNRDLGQEVKAGNFNSELYKQLAKSDFVVAPIRERKDDVPALVTHFSEHFARDGAYRLKKFSEQAFLMMKNYDWPGNVRELKNFIERIYILTPGEFVDVHDLRFAGLGMSDKEDGGSQATSVSGFKAARAQFEKEYILKSLEENAGNISKTAEAIGLERSHLHRKIKSYGIDVP